MLLIRKCFFFLLLILLCPWWAHGQTASGSISLEQAFTQLQQKFNCTFSYSDLDLEGHIISFESPDSLSETIELLDQLTLFNYTLLPDRTIAVQRKDSVTEICGRLLDDLAGTAISAATILTPYQRISTGGDGRFSAFLRRGDEPISVSATGYNPQQFTGAEFSVRPCKAILMIQKIEQLEQVFLNNYLAKGIDKNLNGSLSIDYDNFDILPGLIETDVLQTVQALPGIQSVNESVSFINIRGGTNDQNLILLDGVKMYQNGHFFGLISAFNPFLTKEVNIIKNGSSAAYGEGVSGIIAMEGDSQVNDSFKAGAGTNMISSDAYVDIPLGKTASLQLAGRGSINGILETPTFTSYFNRIFQNTEVSAGNATLSVSDDAFNFFDGYARLLVQPTEKDYIRLNFLLLGNDLEFLENVSIEDELVSRGSSLDQNNISAGLYYRRQWNDQLFTDVQLYGTSYALRASNVDVINNQRLLQENQVLESGIKLRGQYRFTEQWSGLFGYQLNETGITNFEEINNPLFSRTDKQVIRTNSVFAEGTYRSKNKQTSLTLGVRANHVGKFNTVLVEPRLSFNQRFLDYFSFELLGELKSQVTSQIIDFQDDFLGVENRRWVLSRPDAIPILKGQQLSTGVTFLRRGWQVTVEPYLKHIDGITTQSQGFQNQLQEVRDHGSYFVTGVDVLVNKRFKNINTWLSYSYADNKYDFERLVPSEFPNNLDITHTLSSGINYSLNQFNLAAGFNWHSGRPTTPVSGLNADSSIDFGVPNSVNIRDYFRVDTSATYRFPLGKKAKGFVGVSIWNLLNEDNVVNTFFRVNEAGALEQVDERALEFTPNVSLRVQF